MWYSMTVEKIQAAVMRLPRTLAGKGEMFPGAKSKQRSYRWKKTTMFSEFIDLPLFTPFLG